MLEKSSSLWNHVASRLERHVATKVQDTIQRRKRRYYAVVSMRVDHNLLRLYALDVLNELTLPETNSLI